MNQEHGNLVARINTALDVASTVFAEFTPGRIASSFKSGDDPLTEADIALDAALKESLLELGEGWLSEETADDASRLDQDFVWVVDPLDGTREFVQGIPEFCVSVAAVLDGQPVAGGVLNPAADIRVVGALGAGVTCNNKTVVNASNQTGLTGNKVLASRSEWNRGQWQHVEQAGIEVEPMGSVAYKMARVAAALDVATWTAVPKHEWDVAGGAALIAASGGTVVGLDGKQIVFNRPNPLLTGAVALAQGMDSHLSDVLDLAAQTPT